MKRIELKALDSSGRQVTSNNWEERVCLACPEKQINISKRGDTWVLYTPKDTYELTKHPSQNYYHAICAGHKVQVTIKKMVGELRYW